MSYSVIAKFENEYHTYEVHKHPDPLGAGDDSFYVVRDDHEQHGAYHDEDRAIEVAEKWAGKDANRLF